MKCIWQAFLYGVSRISRSFVGNKKYPQEPSVISIKRHMSILKPGVHAHSSGSYPYVYVDGVYLKRSWGGEIQNVSILVAIGVSTDGCREIIGAAEGMKEDKESWRSFFVWLKERGLTGVRLVIGDKNLGMLETIPEVFPDACYQRCTVHFYRNIFSVTPRNKMKAVAMMLKAIDAQESKGRT